MLFDDEKLETPSEAEEPKSEPIEEQEEKVDARFLVEKDKALKEERKRRKEAELELDKLRKASAAPPLDPAKIVEQVRADLQKESYDKSISDYIGKLSNLTDEETKQLKEQITLLPKSGNPALDADFALDRLRRLAGTGSQSSTLSPMSAGVGASNFSAPMRTGKPPISDLAKEYGKDIGRSKNAVLTEEDYKRFDGNVII